MTIERNEAAGRLRNELIVVKRAPALAALLDEALATERRLTVERIGDGVGRRGRPPDAAERRSLWWVNGPGWDEA